jgi:AAA domain-containing protein
MSEFIIQPAVKRGRKARIFLSGVSGSGKSFTAYQWAGVLGGCVVVIDTENDSALDYAGDFDFHHLPLRPPYTVARYCGAMDAAISYGADVVVIDSTSHAWAGKGGLLEVVDRSGSGDGGKFGNGWKVATPQHLDLIEHMTSLPAHLIATARSKQEYAMERGESGPAKVVKLGMAPVQRDGLEYEFSVTADITREHLLTVTKTRCRDLDDYSETKPGTELAERLLKWLTDGPTVADQVEVVYGGAIDATSADALATLYRSTSPVLLGEPVSDGQGGTVKLSEFITARGLALRAEENAARRAQAQPESQPA